jgi:hypothetical protein
LQGTEISAILRRATTGKDWLMTNKRFWAVGGVFTNGEFSTLEPGTGVSFGPFHTREEAEALVMQLYRKNIDICWYNLFVAETP